MIFLKCRVHTNNSLFIKKKKKKKKKKMQCYVLQLGYLNIVEKKKNKKNTEIFSWKDLLWQYTF